MRVFFENIKAMKILDVYRVKRYSAIEKKGWSDGRSWAAIAFRISGRSQFESNGRLFSADEGSVIYIPSGVSFSRKGGSEELVILHVICHGDGDCIEIANPVDRLQTEKSFLDLYEVWQEKSEGYEYRATAALYRLLGHLKRQKKEDTPSFKSSMIVNAVNIIDSEFDTPSLTVSRLARACNMSEEYFRMLYKSEYGISPRKAITEKRIEKACRLLQAGYFNIERVAEECGFPNTKYFSTVFKKKMNTSPSQYSKRNKNQGRKKSENNNCSV
ncbi:MAG: helix-turn-helix transcriptional regulator [Ruminococcaceae bacterium]|nr:helix-turn-helix transcriptional regulator [Oscillospiraceae bacterium]